MNIKLAAASVAAVATVLLTGCATSEPVGTQASDSVVSDTPTSSAPTTPEEPPSPVYDAPAKDNLELDVKVLTKSCFGSAGCNLTYRVHLSESEGVSFDPDTTYDITYKILGGEDPQINTLQLTGDNYEVTQEEFISTPSSHSEPRAVITDISEQ